jgi:hypothetical protein
MGAVPVQSHVKRPTRKTTEDTATTSHILKVEKMRPLPALPP